jgi:rhamnosyl/mannosyltransferase
MNVIHLGKYYYPEKGGIETYIKSLVDYISVKQEVIVSNTSFDTKVEKVGKTKVTRLGRIFNLFSLNFNPEFPNLLKQTNADVYHLHMPNPMAEWAFLTAKPKGKLIVTWHSDVVKQKLFLPLYQFMIDKILERADKIIVTSPQYLETSRFLKKYASKCVIIPLGVDFSQYMPSKKDKEEVRQIKLGFKRKIILFVGRLVYYKGIEYLIDAVKNLDADLLLIGEGPLMGKLKLKATSNVHFLGEVENIKPYYHACDMLVLPSVSRAEAFGFVQLEAIACKKPVISTKLNTGVEFVNKYGILVEPKNVLALKEAIFKLLDSNNKDIASKSYDYCKKNFEIRKIAKEIEKIYRE